MPASFGLVSAALHSVVVLLVAVGLLNGSGGALLLGHVVAGELSPELLELLHVPLNVEWVVDYEQVLLIVLTGLECPVERTSQKESIVDDHELVVHVVLGLRVCSDWDASVCQVLAIVALVLHALIIGDHAHINTTRVNLLNGIGKLIVSQVEDADKELALGHLDVALKLANVIHVREEEGIHVPGLGAIQVLSDLVYVLPQVGKDFFVSVRAHLACGDVKEGVDRPLNIVTLVAARHLGHNTAELIQIRLLSAHSSVVCELGGNLIMGALDSAALLVCLDHTFKF